MCIGKTGKLWPNIIMLTNAMIIWGNQFNPWRFNQHILTYTALTHTINWVFACFTWLNFIKRNSFCLQSLYRIGRVTRIYDNNDDNNNGDCPHWLPSQFNAPSFKYCVNVLVNTLDVVVKKIADLLWFMESNRVESNRIELKRMEPLFLLG